MEYANANTTKEGKMLTDADQDAVREIIEDAMEQLGDRLRAIVAEELDKRGYRVRVERDHAVTVPLVTTVQAKAELLRGPQS